VSAPSFSLATTKNATNKEESREEKKKKILRLYFLAYSIIPKKFP
jgi:hypothetical protein